MVFCDFWISYAREFALFLNILLSEYYIVELKYELTYLVLFIFVFTKFYGEPYGYF